MAFFRLFGCVSVIAQIYNELAGRYKPRSPYYLANKEYFQSLGDAECEVNI